MSSRTDDWIYGNVVGPVSDFRANLLRCVPVGSKEAQLVNDQFAQFEEIVNLMVASSDSFAAANMGMLHAHEYNTDLFDSPKGERLLEYLKVNLPLLEIAVNQRQYRIVTCEYQYDPFTRQQEAQILCRVHSDVIALLALLRNATAVVERDRHPSEGWGGRLALVEAALSSIVLWMLVDLSVLELSDWLPGDVVLLHAWQLFVNDEIRSKLVESIAMLDRSLSERLQFLLLRAASRFTVEETTSP